MVDRTAQLKRLFQQDPNLPTFPEHIRRIFQLLAQEGTAVPDIARELEKDPVLTLRVLRLANSAAYGQTREVNSLDRALAVLGLSQLGAVLGGFASVDGCERFLGDSRFDWKEFWAHCSGTAFIARTLAGRLGLALRGEEFLGGLLHDIGYLALAKAFPSSFVEAVQVASQQNGYLSRSLHERFGLPVEAAGDILAEASKLAPSTREVIRHLHAPDQAPANSRALVAVVSLANELAHLYGLTFFRGTAEMEVVLTSLPAWKVLVGLEPETAQWDLARLVLEIEREQAASQDFIRASHSN